MARSTHRYQAGMPFHVVQRGNNRQSTFLSDEDREDYLKFLGRACERFGVKLHAYVLMTNHTHLLMTPGSVEGISRVMQSLGRNYVQTFNKRYQRVGTLWESRHSSHAVHSDNYLLRLYAYIELNPVRARIVASPGRYHWSSYGHNGLGVHQSIVTEHPLFLQLSSNEDMRMLRYREIIFALLDEQSLLTIRTGISEGRSLTIRDEIFAEYLQH